MRTLFLTFFCIALCSLPARAVFAPPPATPAAETTTATAFPTRAAVEAELGRKLKFSERLVLGVMKRKAHRQARRAARLEQGERRTGPVSALAAVSFSLGLAALVSIFFPASGLLFLLLTLGAIITGVIALVQLGGRSDYKRGRGLAIAGIAAPVGFILLGLILVASIL